MTFEEAVVKMAAREELGFRTVEYEVAFHTPMQRNCKLYAAAYGGIIINHANSWDEAFIKFDAMIVTKTFSPSDAVEPPGQAPA